MPGVANYLPAQDAKFNQWLSELRPATSANPAAYGLTNSDAATIANHVANWSAAYQPITSPATKTARLPWRPRNAARVAVTAQIRTYAQAIANNPGVSSGNKIGLRLNPRTSPWRRESRPL